MKKYFNKRIIIILVAALLIAVFAAVRVAVSDNADGRLSGALNTLTVPVRKGMGALVDSLEQMYGYLYKYDRLEQENEELRAKVAELETQTREYSTLNEENQELRDLLGFTERNEGFQVEEALLLNWSASNFSSSFTINRGSSTGIKVNDCIINSTGALIGTVTSVSSNSAVVTTLIDTNMSIGAEVRDVHELALAEGDFRLMKDSKLKLTYLAEGSQLVPGYTVTTSGGSGMYPKGLMIGTVESVVPDSVGLDDYAVVVPTVELEKLTTVYVVTNFNND
jgi:rod shape-determining protein MreC